jgi:hypothetical protein
MSADEGEREEASWTEELWDDMKKSTVRFLVGACGFALVSEGSRLAQNWMIKRRAPLAAPVRFSLGRNALRVGLWAAGMRLVYKHVRRWSQSGAVAGAAAGATIAIMSPLRGTFLDPVEIALHAAVRASERVGAVAVSHGLVPKALAEYGSTLLFVGASTEILFAWFYEPEALPASYRMWITRMADMDVRLLEALRQLRAGRVRYGRSSPILRDYCIEHGLDPLRADLVHGQIPCAAVHPECGQSCSCNFFTRWFRGALAASVLYLPVHTLAALVALAPQIASFSGDGPKRIAELLWRATGRTLSGALRSSVFLGLYIGLVWLGVCVTRNTVRNDLVLGPWLGSFLCGWSVLLEPPARRMELASFVLPRALHSLWFRLKRAGLGLRDVPMFHVLLCAAACGVMVPAWEEGAELRPMLRAVLTWVLGDRQKEGTSNNPDTPVA